MPSVIINNLFKINELIKLGDPTKLPGKVTRSEDELKINRNILFERKIIQIKCKYQVISEFAKKNYFLKLNEGTGWDIYWTDRQFLSVRQMKSMMPYQRINYFPGMSILTNKQNLTQRLNLYKQRFPQDYDFFPKTWVVDKHSTNIPNMMQDTKNIFEFNEEKQGTKNDTELHNNIRDETKENSSELDQQNCQHTRNTSSNLHYENQQTVETAELHNDIEPLPDLDIEIHKRQVKDKALVKAKQNETSHTDIKEPRNKPQDTEQIDTTKTEKAKTKHSDIVTDHVLKEFMNAMKPLQTHAESSSEEQNIETVKKINEAKHDETIVNELAEAKRKTSEENEKRTKEIDSETKLNKLKELGIKTRTVVLPTLKNTTTNKRYTQKPVVNNIATSNVLFKDNVKNMVMAMDRLNKTVGTVNKWQRVTKENIVNKQNTKQGEDKEDKSSDEGTNNKEHVEVEGNTKIDDVQMKVIKENERKATVERVESKPIYILKPCDGCQGKGIKLAMNIDNIVRNMEFDAMICQQYITNPLLWNGYKFDIRFYILITSIKHLRIYVYNEGIVRLATEKYELPDETNIDNMFMHLTNYSINKNSENFNEDLSKQSLERMNKFLEEEHGVDLGVLYGKINDIIVKTILTGYKPILKQYKDTFKNYVYREACFQLLGFDIILDNQYNPYLLEINKNASLNRPTAIDKLIKTKLTRDLFNILNLNEGRFRGDILRDNLNYNTYRKYNIENEISNRGDFSMVYPCVRQEDYTKYVID